VPDLPGFGKSARPPHPYGIPELADALARFMDAAGIERATLLGNSLGCPIIGEFLDRHHDRIERAIFVSPAGGLYNQPLPRASRSSSSTPCASRRGWPSSSAATTSPTADRDVQPHPLDAPVPDGRPHRRADPADPGRARQPRPVRQREVGQRRAAACPRHGRDHRRRGPRHQLLAPRATGERRPALDDRPADRRRPDRAGPGTRVPEAAEASGDRPAWPRRGVAGRRGSAPRPDPWPRRLRGWWRRNLPALSAAFRVTAIDLPGFGGTHRDARLVLDAAPAQVATLLDVLGIERAHVMAIRWAARRRRPGRGVPRAGRPARARGRRLRVARPASRHRITGPLKTLPWTSPSLLPVILRDVVRSGPVRMALATAETLRQDWGHKLPAIAAPTLVVWGQRDRICNPRIGEQLAPSSRMPGWS
jgi:pimeloyl-ACP methyl ester carboxylesterase